MRTIAAFFLSILAGVAALKVLGGLVLPLVGLAFGILAFVLKVVLIGAVVWFVWRAVRGPGRAAA